MKRIISTLISGSIIVAVMVLGISLWKDRKYNLVSIIIAIVSCVPFFYAYEKKNGNIRRMVIIAVLTALAIIGRVIVAIPGFKPVTAVVILVAMYMGPEAGFLCGSMSALVSNIFFGQGPWTPFQMFAWGICGFIAGLPCIRRKLNHIFYLCFYGMLSGILYSFIMDIWTILSFDGVFNRTRYIAAIVAAAPVTLEYGISNIVFLLILRKPIGEKLERIKKKHCIY